MTPYELLLGVLAAGTNVDVDGRMGTNGVPLRAVIPPAPVESDFRVRVSFLKSMYDMYREL